MLKIKPTGFTHLMVACAMMAFFACAPFAPPQRSVDQDIVPPAYTYPSAEVSPSRLWWQAFDDPQLSALINEALSGNFSLKESWARLRQAEALALRAGAALYPDLSAEADTSTGRRQISNGSTREASVESYSIGLLSNYEIDLWGRIRSEREAARLSAAATQEELYAAAITLSANVTTRWIGIISQRMQKDLLQQQLSTNRTLLELVELRFHNALASALDVFQQRQVVERSRAQIPLTEQREQLLMHELVVLLGRSSFKAPEIKRQALRVPDDLPATGLPARLLGQRPDIRAAMRRLQSADWLVAAARADRLPSIRLTGRAAYQAEELDLLLDNWLLNLAANLTAPLLDGGRRTAEVERLRAAVSENLAAYRRIVANAVREVEDALVSEDKLREHIDRLQAQLDAARSALNEARSRYRRGLNDYLPVITQLLTVQNLEIDLIERKADLLVARVDLFRALGGRWPETLAPSAQN